MKILVTGATGLLGSTIAKHLIREGYKVTALCRPTSDRSLLKEVAHEITWLDGDVLNIFDTDAAVEQVDAVVHTAAMVSFIPKQQRMMYEVNVKGTANVVNSCLRYNVKKLCHVSSVAALGRPSKKNILPNAVTEIDESQRWVDSTSNSNYAKTKYFSEIEVWRGISEGLQAVIVNPSIILGDGDWEKSSTRLFKYAFDENLFYSEGLLNYVDAEDVANAVVKLTASEIAGERFVLNGGTITYREFFDKAAVAFGKKPPQKKVNPFLAGIVWRLEAVRSFLFGTNPLLTKETANAALHRFRFIGTKIEQAVDLRYTPLDFTIQRIVHSLQKKL